MDDFFKRLLVTWHQHPPSKRDLRQIIIRFFSPPEVTIPPEWWNLDTRELWRNLESIPYTSNSLADRLWQRFNATLAQRLEDGLDPKNRSDLELIAGYEAGREIFKFLDNHRPWTREGGMGPSTLSLSRYVGILICWAGAEGFGDTDTGEVPEKFLSLYREYSIRFCMAALFQEEIARRIYKDKIKALFAELKYGKKPDPDAWNHLISIILKVTAPIGIGADANPDTSEFQNAQDWACDRIREGLETLHHQPSEPGEIMALLSMAFSGAREKGRAINLKKKASTRGEKKTIALILGQAEEDTGALEEGLIKVDSKIDPARSELIRLGENLSDEQKARVDEKHGENAGAILELKFRDMDQKEIAQRLDIPMSTVCRRLKSIEEDGEEALLELIHPPKRCENLIEKAKREEAKAP
jgi:DNA-directed RNA polymerase specialized sigma24 family protein